MRALEWLGWSMGNGDPVTSAGELAPSAKPWLLVVGLLAILLWQGVLFSNPRGFS